MSKTVERAVNAVIRPPRKKYDPTTIPLCLKENNSNTYIRLPLGFVNKKKFQLTGSCYYNSNMNPKTGGPCVIYLHGNASSQLEGQFLVSNLCKYGIFVYCFDFAGCGCSEGKYVSLGYYEKEDTEFIIDQLHTQFHLGPFILWGRSMGATTALLVDHPLVIGKISDSAFTSIPDMCTAVATSYHLSSVLIPAALWLLKQRILKKAKFDINSVSPVTKVYKYPVPAVFGHAQGDHFVPFEHCRRLYIHYPSREKDIIVLKGGHNSSRTKVWIRFCVEFILRTFKIEVQNPVISTQKLQEGSFHFASFHEMISKSGRNIIKSDSTFSIERDEYSRERMHWKHHKYYKFSREKYINESSKINNEQHHKHHHRNNQELKELNENENHNCKQHHKIVDTDETNNYKCHHHHHHAKHGDNDEINSDTNEQTKNENDKTQHSIDNNDEKRREHHHRHEHDHKLYDINEYIKYEHDHCNKQTEQKDENNCISNKTNSNIKEHHHRHEHRLFDVNEYIRNEYKHNHKKMEPKEENRNDLNGDYKLPEKN